MTSPTKAIVIGGQPNKLANSLTTLQMRTFSSWTTTNRSSCSKSTNRPSSLSSIMSTSKSCTTLSSENSSEIWLPHQRRNYVRCWNTIISRRSAVLGHLPARAGMASLSTEILVVVATRSKYFTATRTTLMTQITKSITRPSVTNTGSRTLRCPATDQKL